MAEQGNISILDIIDGTVVDGPGFRISIYCAGCKHHCKECHNPQSWDIENGKQMGISQLLEIVKQSPWNVTLSGGDPFFQAEEFAQLAKLIKEETSKTIWCYTGYTLEYLLKENNPHRINLLKHIDTLVDGPFIKDLADESLRFRGSSNQRIIDVSTIIFPKESL